MIIYLPQRAKAMDFVRLSPDLRIYLSLMGTELLLQLSGYSAGCRNSLAHSWAGRRGPERATGSLG